MYGYFIAFSCYISSNFHVLFENLLNKLKLDFVTILLNLKVVESSNNQEETFSPKKIDKNNLGKKIGRNEPCFCGSGKKYKHCCGAL